MLLVVEEVEEAQEVEEAREVEEAQGVRGVCQAHARPAPWSGERSPLVEKLDASGVSKRDPSRQGLFL